MLSNSNIDILKSYSYKFLKNHKCNCKYDCLFIQKYQIQIIFLEQILLLITQQMQETSK